MVHYTYYYHTNKFFHNLFVLDYKKRLFNLFNHIKNNYYNKIIFMVNINIY